MRISARIILAVGVAGSFAALPALAQDKFFNESQPMFDNCGDPSLPIAAPCPASSSLAGSQRYGLLASSAPRASRAPTTSCGRCARPMKNRLGVRYQ